MENNKRISVSIPELLKLKEELKRINDTDLDNIDFIDENNQVVVVNEKILKQFKFIGLNNTDLITTEFYKYGFGTSLNSIDEEELGKI